MTASSYDLIVVGAGSGNTLLGPPFDQWRTAIVEPDRFGGTCLNRGCVPSKMLTATADAMRSVHASARLGVRASLDRMDWAATRDRIFGRIDPLHQAMSDARRSEGIDVYSESARFTGPRTLQVGADSLTADNIVLAAGSRPALPELPGIETVPYHTSDTIMRLPEPPTSMVIVGGGFITAEMAHVFDAFGTSVTIVQRGPRLLPGEDEDISARFTQLAENRFRVFLDSEASSVTPVDGGVRVRVERAAGHSEEIEAEVLFLATGRRPNADLLDVTAGGLEVDRHGHVVTDAYYRTSVPGVWSLGDATNHFQLKHRANAEARTVAHNLRHPEDLRALVRVTPHAVFSEPQIASAGLTEAEAQASTASHVIAVQQYAEVTYGWALEDTTGFVKLIADERARTLAGAHIIGPQAPLLIQPLLQGMMLGQTVDQLAHDVLYIHPALTEVIEQALLRL